MRCSRRRCSRYNQRRRWAAAAASTGNHNGADDEQGGDCRKTPDISATFPYQQNSEYERSRPPIRNRSMKSQSRFGRNGNRNHEFVARGAKAIPNKMSVLWSRLQAAPDGPPLHWRVKLLLGKLGPARTHMENVVLPGRYQCHLRLPLHPLLLRQTAPDR
jgi:hypothetical protein